MSRRSEQSGSMKLKMLKVHTRLRLRIKNLLRENATPCPRRGNPPTEPAFRTTVCSGAPDGVRTAKVSAEVTALLGGGKGRRESAPHLRQVSRPEPS
ncbi:hypothetical protein FQA47_016064 [Oryzias melastigma]|uniref:Uncharacterized protein n=1 Tax=Oryzias melastigma TaxID=30732 RepID=A0A834FN03_ORYME|nr:hypothetical protein FQA47_016064 [Oryzias melastigma]